MLKNTKMDEVRSLAKVFLYLDIQKTKFSPAVISHPFWESALQVVVPGKDGLGFVNLLKDPEGLAKARKIKEAQIDDCATVVAVISLITKPFRCTFLHHAGTFLSQRDLSKALRVVWQEG